MVLFSAGYNPDKNLVHFFLQGISEGFRVGFNYQHCTLKISKKNLACATSHLSVIDHYLKTEVKLSRLAGPLTPSSMPEIHYTYQIWCHPQKPSTQQMEAYRIFITSKEPQRERWNTKRSTYPL